MQTSIACTEYFYNSYLYTRYFTQRYSSLLGSRYALRDVTFQEPEIEDMIRRIYEIGLLL